MKKSQKILVVVGLPVLALGIHLYVIDWDLGDDPDSKAPLASRRARGEASGDVLEFSFVALRSGNYENYLKHQKYLTELEEGVRLGPVTESIWVDWKKTELEKASEAVRKFDEKKKELENARATMPVLATNQAFAFGIVLPCLLLAASFFFYLGWRPLFESVERLAGEIWKYGTTLN